MADQLKPVIATSDTPPISDLLSVNGARTYLGGANGPIARSFIYQLMQKHGLPARRIGSRWQFSRRELDSWIAAQPGVNLPQAG